MCTTIGMEGFSLHSSEAAASEFAVSVAGISEGSAIAKGLFGPRKLPFGKVNK